MKKQAAQVVAAPKRWLSTEEVMKYLDCSADFVERIRESPIVVVKVGKKYLHEIGSIDKFLLRNRV